MSDSGIELKDLFNAVNRKDRDWWERLSDTQQEKFAVWIYNRYFSSVISSNKDIKNFYLLATNQYLNKNQSILFKNHKKLIYLLMTTIPLSNEKYNWIKALRKNKSNKSANNKIKILSKLMPSSKDSDIEALANVMSDSEFEELLIDHGWELKKIKAELKK